ncbi:hypothetical protein N5079_30445 [Planotetraspora sp. A-T 1434]|uniref:hypothetical protein n=1 Tax=Planotetraspora sp. A-T 1434 TaxID=2979219 RepID=UPI0021BE207E|nr:hypothetical protein [Planotetraspora sp. A-T 1434]MCT9934534.1 hypothetical protein [Planotetraspora sp. A-T 1434]
MTIHDPASNLLALVADLPVPEAAGLVELYAECVALLACRAEVAAFHSVPQKKLGAGTASHSLPAAAAPSCTRCSPG